LPQKLTFDDFRETLRDYFFARLISSLLGMQPVASHSRLRLDNVRCAALSEVI